MRSRNPVQWVYAAKNNRELEARYDEWAPKYDRDLTKDFEWLRPQVAVDALARYARQEATILDMGAGTGPRRRMSHRRRLSRSSGDGLSPGMLEVARQKNIHRKLWQMTVGERLPFASDTFDAVIGVGVFSTGHAPVHAFDELVRITRSGGHIVCSLKTDVYEQDGFGQYLPIWRLRETGAWSSARNGCTRYPRVNRRSCTGSGSAGSASRLLISHTHRGLGASARQEPMPSGDVVLLLRYDSELSKSAKSWNQ